MGLYHKNRSLGKKEKEQEQKQNKNVTSFLDDAASSFQQVT